MKAFTIIILATLSINLSAQLEVNSSGKVGIKTTPTLGTLEIGNINGYNLSGTFIGAEFRIGRYTSGWNMGFVQARDNTNNEIGLRFRTQKAGGTITNAMHIYPDGHVSFYEPVYFQAGHSNISSDERFKKDIKNLEKTEIHKLYSLNGKEYTRIFQIADTAETSEAKEITEYGLIAQELKEIYPKLVTINEDGFYSIKYTALIPIIIEALKEQQIEIDNLKNSNNTLKSASIISDVESNNVLETEAILYQNAPNPFSEHTEIKYFLPEKINHATLYIYDMQGVQLKTIPLPNRGVSNETIYGSSLQAGMYIYALIADGKEIDSKRMILTK